MNWKRLQYLLPSRRRREEREIQEELASLAAMGDPGELGNLTLAAENARETWGWTWLESIVADVRYALRTLRPAAGFRGGGRRFAGPGHRCEHCHFQFR
jgi:hypothetical protein